MGSPAYDRENTTQIRLKLNNKTDADILEWLAKQPSKQGYIKRLIREDIEKSITPETNLLEKFIP